MALPTLRYDLRVPPFAATTHRDAYKACIEQCAWAEDHGINTIVFSEHHGVDDGFMPSPIAMCAAAAAVTDRAMLMIQALLVPLHDPLRLAEDIATLDLISGGRVHVVAGLGYRDEEFEMFGVERKRRAPILEESIEVMRKAWTGEPFEYKGRRARVMPRPFSQPHPMIWIGGSTEKAAKRAARMGLPFLPAVGDPELKRIYEEEAAEVGFMAPFCILPKGPGFVHITDDPERDWKRLEPHLLWDAQTYASWQVPGQRSEVSVHNAETLEDVKASGVYKVVTPEECIALNDELGPIAGLVLHPLLAGMPIDMGWSSLELFATKVRPHI